MVKPIAPSPGAADAADAQQDAAAESGLAFAAVIPAKRTGRAKAAERASAESLLTGAVVIQPRLPVEKGKA